MATIELNKLVKRYGKVEAVRGIDLQIADGEFVVFVGPSGCGKSTTLRMIAGLEDISGGELKIGNEVVNERDPKQRNIAMVFQNYAIYPHMTVRQNIGFGLYTSKTSNADKNARIEETAKILGLEPYLDRRPAALSGGQRQRVAIGRAMVRNPSAFLFDEPLSNLDAQLRAQMRIEIKRLHQRLKTTSVYVTHDQVEAMTMADRIVVMKDGHIQQVDTPQNLYDRPINMFVAGFIGAPQMNMLPVTLRREGDGFIAIFDGNPLPLPAGIDTARLLPYEGKDIVLGIRPENFHEFAPADIDAANVSAFKATLELAEPMGSEVHLNLISGGQNLVARVSPRFRAKIGDPIELVADLTNTQLFDPATEQSILY